MAYIFLAVLLIYYWLVLKRRAKNGAVLAVILWGLYFILGVSAAFIELTNGISPIFEPNYWSVMVLLTGILLSISGFLNFRKQSILQMPNNIRNNNLIENFLIASQLFSILFFLPFAAMSLIGDQNENRLLLSEKAELLGSYGLLNTFAGAASQLFSASLVFAFVRLCKDNKNHHNVNRAYILIISSLSYVVYILAYVGRDGVVYWLMTYVALYFVFRDFISPATKKKTLNFLYVLVISLLIPFLMITISRFSSTEVGLGWSFFEYFGAQIHNFSDFSSIVRPITFGMQNFPLFIGSACDIFGIQCISWNDMRDSVFYLYLDQGKVPWVFGTFVSDFVADFGEFGALTLILFFCLLSLYVCNKKTSNGCYSLPRFLLIIFLFSVPYWGVFYFRFSIINGYIIVNLLFIFILTLMDGKLRKRLF